MSHPLGLRGNAASARSISSVALSSGASAAIPTLISHLLESAAREVWTASKRRLAHWISAPDITHKNSSPPMRTITS
jgi:hypothetical protein